MRRLSAVGADRRNASGSATEEDILSGCTGTASSAPSCTPKNGVGGNASAPTVTPVDPMIDGIDAGGAAVSAGVSARVGAAAGIESEKPSAGNGDDDSDATGASPSVEVTGAGASVALAVAAEAATTLGSTSTGCAEGVSPPAAVAETVG